MVACSNPSTPTPIPHVDAELAAIARKRRAELLRISRAQNASGSESDEPEMVLAPVVSTADVVMSQGNKRKISDASSSSSNTSTTKNTTKKKRPTQMRYDPDVPMTKEEAAAWRREARRVRNRQSAAASRQKTRARIEELEVEVESWQKKYAALEAKVRAYELQHCVNVMQSEVVTRTTTVVPNAVHSSGSAVSSIEGPVKHSAMASAAAALIDLSPVLSAATEQIEARYNSMEEQHLNIISRPAVS